MSKQTELDLEAGVEIANVPEGSLVAGCFQGKPALLTRYKGRYCAFERHLYSHGRTAARSIVVDGEVHCPWHHARFSILTGEATGAPAFAALTQLGTSIRDGRVFVTGSPESKGDPAPAAGSRRVVIVGAGAGGHACAQLLARSGYPGSITVISDDPDPPYDRTACSKQYLIGMQSRHDSLMTDADLYRNDVAGVPTLRKGKVRTLNAQQKSLLLEDGERIDFDVLVMATGAEPNRPRWAGSDLPNVHVLRTLRDADAIIERSKGARQVAVIGSSFIGLEAAASLQQRKLSVHVVTPEDVPLKKLLGADIGQMIRSVHEEKGVKFHFEREVERYDGRELILNDRRVIPADFVVLGIGGDAAYRNRGRRRARMRAGGAGRRGLSSTSGSKLQYPDSSPSETLPAIRTRTPANTFAWSIGFMPNARASMWRGS